MLTRLTRAAIVMTAISGVLFFVFLDVGRMLTTRGDFLVWTVPFSRRIITLPDWAGVAVLYVPLLSMLVVIVLWVSVAVKARNQASSKEG